MGSVKASYGGIGQMLNADFMEAAMRARAERAMAVMVTTAPFDPKSTDGTHYKDSFTVDAGRHGGVRHDRAYGRVTNDDPAAFYIEFGTKDTPRHRTMGNAIHTAE